MGCPLPGGDSLLAPSCIRFSVMQRLAPNQGQLCPREAQAASKSCVQKRLCCVIAVLKFSITVSLNLCFVSEVWIFLDLQRRSNLNKVTTMS